MHELEVLFLVYSPFQIRSYDSVLLFCQLPLNCIYPFKHDLMLDDIIVILLIYLSHTLIRTGKNIVDLIEIHCRLRSL